MLKKSLIAATNPVANDKNIVFWKDYRVTVLQDRLFRLEKGKTFRDCATQTVWFRNMESQSFTFTDKGDTAVVDTGACRLILSEKRKDCRIELNGKAFKIGNSGNLKGTARTLDLCDGDSFFPNLYNGDATAYKVQLENGVCSKTGVAVLEDSHSLTLGEDGQVKAGKYSGSDEYIFAYGSDFRGALKALYLITGSTPKIPRFALGNWWSRYHAYTDKEYLRLLNGFEEHEVPLTVATIDMDWHHSGWLDKKFDIKKKDRNTEFYGGEWGWTGYSWNQDLFPDYKAFLKKIQEKNLKITLNLHPADGIRWWEDMYPQMAEAMGIDPETAEQVKFDITDTKFINAYFDIVHKPYEKDGVAFWWIDWQQGASSKIEGLDPLWSLNHYHYLDNGENHSDPMILSRYSGLGSHRYPLGFSGDTFVTWKTLRYLPYFTANAANAGYTWWSHDIGGHQQGDHNGEMYARHIQYGVFSPINRLHCSDALTMTKEPWAYENGAGKVAEDFMRLRHAMIPFLYTQSWRTHKEGKALVEPLYYQWNCKEAYTYKNEYLFGDLLVAPVVSPSGTDGYARVKAWIPEGKWTDIFTGDCYEAPAGGREVTLLCHLERYPVLAKAGTILPLSRDEGNACGNPEKLEVGVYSGNGKFSLYEDGKAGECFTNFSATNENGVQILTIQTEGQSAVIPENRTLRVLFKDIPDGEVTLYKNGRKWDTEALLTSCAGMELAFDPDADYRIEVTYQPQTEIQKQIVRAGRVLLRAEDNHNEKNSTYRKLMDAKNLDEYKSTVEESKLKTATKLRLLETIL